MKASKVFGIAKLVSGGQSGVDRAALDVALELGIPCGGWCPLGRLAEDGIIASKYPLIETPNPETSERTRWNVRDSDATLILTKGNPTDGTGLTIECAQELKKPYLVVTMPGVLDQAKFEQWISINSVKVLNVAGPRESHEPGVIYKLARMCLLHLFTGT